ncbi:MAG: YihY/virulence factor BrkB family protein [Bradymonadaceae bacterium]
MKEWIAGLPGVPGHVVRFGLHVVSRFFGPSNGLLLSGAVAYNTLLSVVPLLALILVFASHFIDEYHLLATISVELHHIVPGQAEAMTEALTAFMEARELIGFVGFLVLLFFSSIAFRVLENAMGVIFGPHPEEKKRSFWMSALMPYLFITVLGLGVMVLTAGAAAIDAIGGDTARIPFVNIAVSLDRATSILLYGAGVIGLTLLFTSIYKVLPVTKIQFRRALIGGLTAAVLWEVVRHVLVWYFSNISLVNIVYGSLATVIIVLLTMEVAAIILLLGAQVIAQLERNAHAGVPWYENTEEAIARRIEESRAEANAPSRQTTPSRVLKRKKKR